MPLLFEKALGQDTKIALWKIEEPESFFSSTVKIQKEITHPHKRLQHFAGRHLLQYMYPDFPVPAIRLTSANKPYLPDNNYQFSISHCRDYAAAIVSKTERVGIDIEYEDEKLYRLQHKFLNKKELSYLDDNHVLKKLVVLWSIKEAMFKWWGQGGVDFRKNLLIDDFVLSENGKGNAIFNKENFCQPLLFHYCFLEKLCLVWIGDN